ncbi:MAG: GldG family protein [Planctomycetota bacterium]|nr:GldG family protein [Planctomycetota bacterium]
MKASMSRGTRAVFAFQVLLATALAVAGAVLAMELAHKRYLRVDLSANGRNTVDEATLDMIARLPDTLHVDTFFRGLDPPFDAVSLEAIRRMLGTLRVVAGGLRNDVKVEVHDMRDVALVRERQHALGVEGENVMVVRLGERKTVVELFGEIAVVDWGNPSVEGVRYLAERGIPAVDPRTWRVGSLVPARLIDFRGRAALAQAIAKVSAGGSPRVYFSQGHGERSFDGTLVSSVARLKQALERDGFEVETWDPARDGAVPKGCEVLAVVGPDQPFAARELEWIRGYVGGGGRLIAALEWEFSDGEGSLAQLLAGYGLRPVHGVVCLPITDLVGNLVEGDPLCAELHIGKEGMAATHPVTEPLHRRNRRVRFAQTDSFDVGASPQQGRNMALVYAPRTAWRDVRLANGDYDHAFDNLRETTNQAFALCVLSAFAAPPAADGTPVEARVLALGSASFLAGGSFSYNRDLLLNAFNWMVERDYRVAVSPRDEGLSYLDVERGNALATVAWVLLLGLPGLCALTGVVVAWGRKR